MKIIKSYLSLKLVSLSAILFLCISSIILTIFFNFQAFQIVFLQNNSSGLGIFFKISVFLLVFAVILFSTIPFLLFNIPKIGMFLFFITAASTAYFTYKYGIIVEGTVTKSIFETSYAEASQYLNLDLILWNILSLLIFGLVLFYIKIKPETFLQRILSSFKILSLVIGIVAFLAIVFYKDYASFLRNNRQIRHMVNPVSSLYEVARYWKIKSFPKVTTFVPIGINATSSAQDQKRKKLVVLVVGETARADHFSLNGYKKNDTTPNLNKQEMVSLPNVVSCGTATAISVPCMFSDLDRKHFDSDNSDMRGNLLDVIKNVGYNVYWVDNNTGCQGVCDRVKNIDIKSFKNPNLCNGVTCYDEILVEALKTIPNNDENYFVVLHMLGSHGPTYYLRYPDEFKKFKPSCDTSELGQCSQEQLINTYDNTILYTDYVLNKIIDQLEVKSQNLDTALIYVSDHGESLGEKGLYLHSLPYMLAPKEQKEIPMMFWFSKGFKENPNVLQFSKSNYESCNFSHDYLFSTVLRLLEITADVYDPHLDLFNINDQHCNIKLIGKQNTSI